MTALAELSTMNPTYWAEYPGGWEEAYRTALASVPAKRTGTWLKGGTVNAIVNRAKLGLGAIAHLNDDVGLEQYLRSLRTPQRQADFRTAWRAFADWFTMNTTLPVAKPGLMREVDTLTNVGMHLLTIYEEVPNLSAEFFAYMIWGAVLDYETDRVHFPSPVTKQALAATSPMSIQAIPLTPASNAAVVAIRRWGYPERRPLPTEPFVPRVPVRDRRVGVPASLTAIRTALRVAREARNAAGEVSADPLREDNPLARYATLVASKQYDPRPYRVDPDAIARGQDNIFQQIAQTARAPAERYPISYENPVTGEPMSPRPGETQEAFLVRRGAWSQRQNVIGSPGGGGGSPSSSSSGAVNPPNVSGSVGETPGIGTKVEAGGEKTGMARPSAPGAVATASEPPQVATGAPPVLIWGEAPAAPAVSPSADAAADNEDAFDPPAFPGN